MLISGLQKADWQTQLSEGMRDAKQLVKDKLYSLEKQIREAEEPPAAKKARVEETARLAEHPMAYEAEQNCGRLEHGRYFWECGGCWEAKDKHYPPDKPWVTEQFWDDDLHMCKMCAAKDRAVMKQ